MNVAKKLGYPLNTFVTINFEMLGFECVEAIRCFSRIRTNYFAKWVTRRPVRAGFKSMPPAHVWVFENPHGILNVHWAIHIPSGHEQEFAERLVKWLEKVGGKEVPAGAVDVRPVTCVSRLSLYFLKGAHPAYTTYSRIRHEPQGEIPGRRYGVSRCLNRTARKKAGINGRRARPR